MRLRDDAARGVAQAWQTAALVIQAYVGKLPPLQELIDRVTAPTVDRLTLAQRRTQMAMLSEFTGIQMQPMSEAAKRALMRLRES